VWERVRWADEAPSDAGGNRVAEETS